MHSQRFTSFLNAFPTFLHPFSTILYLFSTFLHPLTAFLHPFSTILHSFSTFLHPPSTFLHPISTLLHPFSTFANWFVWEFSFVKENKIASWYIELISILIFWSKWTYFGLSLNFGQKRPNFGQKNNYAKVGHFMHTPIFRRNTWVCLKSRFLAWS